MFDKISKGLVKVFGSRNERLIKTYMTVAQQAGEYEQAVKSLSDNALKQKTADFKTQITSGTRPQQLLPEAFAVVRETARRTTNMRHFDVQLIGGHVLFQGNIAEMATGEGKTLVATLAAYLLHLTGKKVHVVTVNDYLAKRDAEWMSPVYEALGLTVGAIQADMDTSGEDRRAQYACDITYGTNNEFGFDYLRDNMKTSIEHMAQGPLHYALIDEVDSILIDEARTPLIISGPAHDDITRYKKADQVARKLISLQHEYDTQKKLIDSLERELANAQGELSDSKKAKNQTRMDKAQSVIDKAQSQMDTAQVKLEQATQYYEVEVDRKSAHMTHEGVGAAQEIAGIGSFFTGSNMEWPHLIEQSLRAHVVYEREKDYVVLDGKVVIVDEFTGRLMQGRQWSDGLHQAVEAKEGVSIKEESQTLATITLQNFFKLYEQIGGMTGTAVTESEEFMKIYGLEVVSIPTNKPCARDDRDDLIYQNVKDKFKAIAEEINDVSSAGRPVLVGTISIEKSETLSTALSKRFGLEHEVLNAKQHAREASIVEKAGQQFTGRDGKKRGNVTIATNMAGRGTDIKLGEGVAAIGGLHILGTERHEARRIDNQLRGRAGRQGDNGSSQFFLSFDDDLMRIFASEQTVKLLSLIGWQEGEPIYHKRISKGIEKAQKKVEERNYEIRKSLLEYDEVMDYQRKTFYTRRRQILEGRDLKSLIQDMIHATIQDNCNTILDKHYARNCVLEWARTEFDVELKINDLSNTSLAEIENQIKSKAKSDVTNKVSLSLGEYLEDFDNPKTWNIQALAKWAMSAFQVTLTPSQVRDMSYEEIETLLVDAACQQVDKKDCSQLTDLLDESFPLKRLCEWAKSKFEIQTDIDQLKDQSSEEIQAWLLEKTDAKYQRREIEYPVEFAMSMVYARSEPNVYAFEALSDWINKKYQKVISAEQLQHMTPQAVHKELMQLSETWNQGKLEQEVTNQVTNLTPENLVTWINERFEASLTTDDLSGSKEEITQAVLDMAKNYLRQELKDLEKYVLLQVYDGAWKDHLYTMDHLKDSIWTRSFAEKDPKTEYKREGFKLFEDMLTGIEDRVTDIIFRIHLEAGMRAKNVWNISATAHDQVGQFAMAEQQRAAAQAPQGEVQVKQIVLDQPKVGRNDPCPCGSGKKYKKCCGQND